MQGHLIITGYIAEYPDGDVTIAPPPFVTNTPVYESIQVSIGSGNTAIAVPTGARKMIVTMPPANTQPVQLCDVAATNGVGGLYIDPSDTTVIGIPTTGAQYKFYSTAAVSGETVINFL